MESEPLAQLGELNRLQAELAEVDALIKKHQNKQHISAGQGRIGRLKAVVEEYSNRCVDVIAGSKQFRDELLVSARALSLVVGMAGNASTHREKDARLRGVSELLEGWIQKLEREQFEFLGNNGRFAPFGLCDFPTRHFKERIFELEAQLQEFKSAQQAPTDETNF